MSPRPITIAIAALGGQGGGVLADWIRDLAEANAHFAQSTSVPGVAQRTGSTVYYLELFPESAALAAGREPVLSLSAVAGDVDIVIAAEWMEAGRAVQRGFVTPDRTLLIASTHRAYAVAEKSALGNGIADSDVVMQAVRSASRKLVCFDMQQLAEASGSVISAVLFGALAASAVLPFPQSAFEAVIAGKGGVAEGNQRAFAAALSHAQAERHGATENVVAAPSRAPDSGLAARVQRSIPESLWSTVLEACRQLVAYQDRSHAEQYLDRLDAVLARDREYGGAARQFELSAAAARHLALWMSYQDVIQVATQKTRVGRYAEIRDEVKADEAQLVDPVEFMHPRLEEICDILPRRLGAAILASPDWREFLQRFFGQGRLVRTYHLGGFCMLFILGRLRRLRRLSLRYALENQRMDSWLERICAAAPHSYELAVEITRCQRLLKGYSDTQERGWRNFSRLMDFLQHAPQTQQTAHQLAALHVAALGDEDGMALDAAFRDCAAETAS